VNRPYINGPPGRADAFGRAHPIHPSAELAAADDEMLGHLMPEDT
jgi:hypothetical protein